MTFNKLGVILFLILISFNAESQNYKIDSLKSLLPRKEGLEKAKVFYELGRQYLLTDQNIAAVQIAFQGYKIAREFNDSAMIVQNGRIAAAALRYHGEVDSAIKIYERILPLSSVNENSFHHQQVLSGLAIAYTHTAEYDKALQLHFQCLELKKRNHDVAGESMALNNIGLVYYKLKDYKRAREFFTKTVALKRKINDNYDLGAAFINLGLCEAYLGDYANAERSIRKGIQTSGSNSTDYEVACADFAMGVVHFGLKKYRDAENYFLKSYLLAKSRDYQRFQFDDVDYLTQIYLMQNRISDASYYLREAESLIEAGAPYNLEMIKIYSRFSEMYNKVKNYQKALFYQQKYIELKDSVYNEKLTINLMKVEAGYQERENIAKIAAQEQVLQLKQEIIKRQHVLNMLTSILVLVAIVFMIVLWRNYARKKKDNLMLDEKVKARTAELEISRDALMKALTSRNTLITHAASDVKDALATMQGLCVLGLKDIADPIAIQYIHRMNTTAGNLKAKLELFSVQGEAPQDLS